MKALFLDDERDPKDVTWISIGKYPWEIVRTYSDFCVYLAAQGIPDRISFDNDLGESKEGIDCAHFLVTAIMDGEHLPRDFSYTVHSKNNVAAERIRGLLDPFLEFWRNDR